MRPSKRARGRASAVFAATLGLLAAAGAASGQTGVWTTNGPFGGSVYCLVSDPSHTATLYAGTDRGVYRSDDAGASWRAASAGLPAFRVQTIAIDPTTPSTLYAGTLTPDGIESVGIFKSTDGGASWVDINVGLFDPLLGIGPLDVWSLAIDPKNPQTILAGSRLSEIFKSVDGGQTWQYKTLGGYNVGLETSAFQFDPTTSSNILAASTLGLLRSTDGGETWSGYGNVSDSFFSLATDPTAAATLYAGNVNGSGIFKSTDRGAHWSTVNKGLPTNQGPSGTLPWVLGVSLDPAHPATLYAGTYGNGLYRSTDGGSNWSPAGSGMRTTFVSALVVEPDSTLVAATIGGGVYRSADGGSTWTPSNAGLDAGIVNALLPDPSAPSAVYAALFDGVYRSADGGGTWQALDNGLAIAPITGLVSRPGSPATLLASTLGTGVFKSTDGGATWSASSQGLTDSSLSSIAVDPTNAQTLYVGTDHASSSSQRVFKSTDGGATWAQTGLDAGGNPITFLAVNPANASQVIAMSENVTGYYQSLDAGKTWQPVTIDASCGGVNTMYFNPAGSVLTVGGTTGLCRSSDSGKTWIQTTVGPLASVETFLIDSASASTIYAGASPAIVGGTGGVFRSLDGGATWQPLGTGLSGATVTSLALDAPRGILHAAIHRGGVAELALSPVNRNPILPPPPTGQGPRLVPPR